MPKGYRFKKRVSDRSGFDYLERELVRDNGALVGPDEIDMPPPSNRPTGSEGEVSPGFTRTGYDSYATPAGFNFVTQFVTASGGINFVVGYDESGQRNPNASWIYVSGSNEAITVSANPQITRGQQGYIMTVECVGSNVTLQDGNGLDLRSSLYVMESGSILSLFYSATDNLWHETSRASRTKDYGVF